MSTRIGHSCSVTGLRSFSLCLAATGLIALTGRTVSAQVFKPTSIRTISSATTGTIAKVRTFDIAIADEHSEVAADVCVGEVPVLEEEFTPEITTAVRVESQPTVPGPNSVADPERANRIAEAGGIYRRGGRRPHVDGLEYSSDPAMDADADDEESLELESGFVFVNGEYLPAPCRLEMRDGIVHISGRPVNSPIQDFSRLVREMGSDYQGIQDVTAARLINDTMDNCVLIAIDGQPLICLPSGQIGLPMLNALSAQERTGELVDKAMASVPDFCDQTVVKDWILNFKTPRALSIHVTEYNDLLERTGEMNRAAARANQTLDRAAYPLSIFGMIMTVLACGHLLSNPPRGGESTGPIDATPARKRMVVHSAILVGVLSALDLTWTMLAFNANQMTELNPLGSHLMSNPIALITFKLSATGLGLGLLVALRSYRRAQQASWWACLILTLLTVRWLTFNSMFIGG